MKIELCLKPDFNIQDAFRMLDVDRKGYITALDLADNLNRVLLLERETGIAISKDDIYLIFRRYDSRGMG